MKYVCQSIYNKEQLAPFFMSIETTVLDFKLSNTFEEDKVSEYLELADKTDKAVEAAEPGMLHHTFDQDPEKSSDLCLV